VAVAHQRSSALRVLAVLIAAPVTALSLPRAPQRYRLPTPRLQRASFSSIRAVAASVTDSAPNNGLVLPKIPPSKIRRGDYVVHASYGIGLFEGVYQTTDFTTLPNGTPASHTRHMT